jgi:hypothetical protein
MKKSSQANLLLARRARGSGVIPSPRSTIRVPVQTSSDSAVPNREKARPARRRLAGENIVNGRRKGKEEKWESVAA